MKIVIKTKIPKNFLDIYSKFDQKLFEALSPPLMKVLVDRFDGCNKGDEVHLSMTLFGVIGQRWISLITRQEINENEAFFIDEGSLLPPPLKSWKHIHRINKIDENSSHVIDDIEYTTGNAMLDLLIFPALYSMFYFRKPVYKRELS